MFPDNYRNPVNITHILQRFDIPSLRNLRHKGVLPADLTFVTVERFLLVRIHNCVTSLPEYRRIEVVVLVQILREIPLSVHILL